MTASGLKWAFAAIHITSLETGMARHLLRQSGLTSGIHSENLDIRGRHQGVLLEGGDQLLHGTTGAITVEP